MRILIGPLQVNTFTAFILSGFTDHDVCTFSSENADIILAPDDTFRDLQEKIPPGWTPDLVIFLFPEFQVLLPGIEESPWPTVAFISDWHVNSDAVRSICSLFDVVVTDRHGHAVLADEPGVRVVYRPLVGFDPQLHRRLPDVEPLYDVSIVAHLDADVHAARTHALVQAASLADRFRVRYFTDLLGEAYVQRVNESRITLNHSVRSEMNMRCYEATACGSLLFCERSNDEIREHYVDRLHCVLYDEDNLVSLLEHYLENEDERKRIADSGHRWVQPFTYRNRMNDILSVLQGLTPNPRGMREPAAGRALKLGLQALRAFDGHAAARAVVESERGLALSPRHAALLTVHGCAAARQADEIDNVEARRVLRQRAEASLLGAARHGALPQLNLARFLLADGRPQEARKVLEQLVAEGAPLGPCAAFYPAQVGPFMMAWEREPDTRWNLVMWMAHVLLARLLDDPADAARRSAHLRQALAFRPSAGATWHELAEALPQTSDEKLQALQNAVRHAPTVVSARLDLIRALWTRKRARALEVAASTARLLSAFPYGHDKMETLMQTLQELQH